MLWSGLNNLGVQEAYNKTVLSHQKFKQLQAPVKFHTSEYEIVGIQKLTIVLPNMEKIYTSFLDLSQYIPRVARQLLAL